MKSYTPSKLREDIYRILDEVVSKGIPVGIKRAGVLLKIVPPERKSRLSSLKKRKAVVGNPEDLANISWEHSWKPKHF